MVCKIQYDLSIWDWETLSQLNFEVTGSIYFIFDNSVTQECLSHVQAMLKLRKKQKRKHEKFPTFPFL